MKTIKVCFKNSVNVSITKKVLAFLLVVAFTANLEVLGQTANNYIFSTGTGGTLLAPSYTQLIGSGIDDPASAVTSIGFNFVYEGTTYTQFSVNGNGLMRLGSTVVPTTWTNAITSTGNEPKIMPLWDDLSTASNGGVYYGVSGTAPNRILVVDWKTYNSSSTGSAYVCEFQVLLYETTNQIKFVYGAGTTPGSFSCGIGGAIATNFQSITTSTQTSSNATANDANATWPGSGRYYSFSPSYALNDECSGATTVPTNNSLTCSSSYSDTWGLLSATSSAAGCSAGTYNSDMWYKFVATSSSHRISKTGGFDAYIALYSSCGGSPLTSSSSLTCVDGGTGTGTSSDVADYQNLTIGNTYYIRIWSYSSAPTPGTAFSVCVTSIPTDPTSISVSSSTICSGGSITLTQQGGSLVSGTTWNWYSDYCGGTLIGSGTGSSITVSPTTTTTYYLRAEGTGYTGSCKSVTVPVNQPTQTGVTVSTTSQPAGVSISTSPATEAAIGKDGGITFTYTNSNWPTCANWGLPTTVAAVNLYNTTPPNGSCAFNNLVFDATNGETNLALGKACFTGTYNYYCINSSGSYALNDCKIRMRVIVTKTDGTTPLPFAQVGNYIMIFAKENFVVKTYIEGNAWTDLASCLWLNTDYYNTSVNGGWPGVVDIFNSLHTDPNSSICTQFAPQWYTLTSSATSSSNSPVCFGTSINLSGSTNVGDCFYQWTGPNSFTSTSQNPTITNAQTANGGTYTMIISDGKACYGSSTTNVTIDPIPVAATGITLSATSLCDGETINVSRTGSPVGVDHWWMSRDGVNWAEFSDGYTGSSSWSRVLTAPGSNASYTYSIYQHPYSGTCGWHDWDHGVSSATITLYTATIAGTITGGSTPICIGSSTGTMTLSGNRGSIVRWEKQRNSEGWTTISSTASTYSETPSSAGTWYYRAYVQNGTCTGAYSNTITIQVDATSNAGTVTQSPVSGSAVCSGTNVQYTQSGGVGSFNYFEYQWDGTGGSWSGSWGTTNPYTWTSGNPGHVLNVRAVVTNGACPASVSSPVSVTIKTSSTAPTGIIVTNNNTCNGTSKTLTVDGGSLGTGAVWQWFTGSCGGTSAGTGASISVDPAAGTATTYYVRASGDCNTTTCASTTVTVNSLSTAPTAITGTTTICNGGSTTLTVSGGSLGTGASWKWYSGSCGGTLVGTGSSVTLSPTSTTSYYVRSEGTCNTTTCASTTVTVNTAPTAPTGISGTSTICSGSTTTLTATGGSAGSGCSYEWGTGSTVGSNIISGATSISYTTAALSANTTYWVRRVGTAPCSNTTGGITQLITVNSLSTAPTVITGTTTICNGGSTTLTVSGGSLGTGASWTWYSGSCGGTLVGTGSSVTLSPTSTTSYYVRSEGTCNTTTCASTTVTVNTAPTAPTGISGTSTICSGSTTTLTATGGSAGSGCSYEWGTGSTVGSNTISGATSISYTTAALSSSTTYWVRRVGTAPCSNTTGGITQLITVNTAPTAPTGISGTSTICSGSTTTLTASGGTEGSGCSYEWGTGSTVGSNTISGATSVSYTTAALSSSTTYWVRRVGTAPCSNTTGGITQLITVNSSSTAPTGITVTNNSTCGSIGKTLTVSGGSLGTGANWQWYSGSCGGTPAGTGTSITVSPSATTTYYARSEGTCNTTACASTSVTVITAPANDLCANATAIPSFPYNSGVQSTNCATNDAPAAGSSACGAHDDNVWYKLTGTGNQIQVSTCDGLTDFDTEIHVYTGNCGSMTETTCSDDGIDAGCTNGQSSLTMCTTNGTVYYISIGSYQTSGATGNYVLSVTEKTIGPATITSNSTCGNGPVTLTSNIGTNADAVDFSTDGGSTVSATDASSPYQFTTGSLTAPQAVTVYVRSKNSSSGCVGSWTNSATASAYALPSLALSTLCDNDAARKVELNGSGGSAIYSNYEQQSPSLIHASNIFAVPFSATRNFRVIDSRGCTSGWLTYTAPSGPTQISGVATNGSCIVRGENNWWHITDVSNQVIVSINDNSNDLGNISAWAYLEPSTTYFNQSYYLKRHFKITSEHTPASNVTLRLYFNDSELNDLIVKSKLNANHSDDVNGLSDLKVTRYSGGNEDNSYANNNFGCTSCFTVYSPATGSDMDFGADVKYVEISIPGFSEEWIHGGQNTTSLLPVELLSFSPQCVGKSGLIRWVTASETNNSHFIIQRSLNGIDFTDMSQVQGSGNSSELTEYSYLDTQKPEGLIYYRLKQVDYNGAETTYSPKSLHCDKDTESLKVIPNPFREKISIVGMLSDDVSQLEIYNSEGGKVVSKTINRTTSADIDLSFLQPGIYLLRVTESNGVTYQFKLVKN